MSASSPPASALPGAADPSMDDILASIRRILSEEEIAAGAPAPPATPPAPPAENGVLMLDKSMMIGPPPIEFEAPKTEPALPPLGLEHTAILGAEAEAAAAASVGSLMRGLTNDRSAVVHSGGPTIEDLVREGIRPMLKGWLDTHLPPLVEQLVRAELARISARAAL